MNTAGMMPNLDAQAVRRQYSELGATFSFGVSESYFYITVHGDENNLDQILALLSKHVMMPNLDDKQIKSVVSNAYWSRYSEKRNPNTVASALLEYVLYGENSHYIDRIPMEELYKYSVTPDGEIIENYLVNKTNLTTTIQEAFGYAVDIHYCGQKPIDEVAKSMNAIPMKERMVDTKSPFFRERKTYDKTNVMFLADSKVQQAKVYFYVNSNPYDIKEDVGYDAFNQYFSGGFSGLVMNEIREKRSMAYTAYGYVSTPSIAGKDSYLFGYVGTQGDKVADAIDVFMGLLTDMPAPENAEERMENIRTYLHQSALTAKPGMRAKSQVFEQWKKLGYTDDPAKVNMTTIDNLTYEDIKAFYEANIKGKPVTIVVIGDPKTIDQKAIQAKWGKITKMSPNKLFKGGI
jgi:predicted Zn-dependent peptidase